jgi:SAM-dependent methyltransferase
MMEQGLPPQGRPARPGPPSRDEFDAMYAGKPGWDIGQPQPVLLRLAESGGLRGHVLDVGCGTGEHALMAAQLGYPATGVDTSARAVAIAQEKARERELPAHFLVWNALDLPSLNESFDVVLDSALFHVFDDAQRIGYVNSLRAVVLIGGRYHMLCFSDREPGAWGPRRVSRDEIRSSFADGWRLDAIEPSTIELTTGRAADSWFVSATRI